MGIRLQDKTYHTLEEFKQLNCLHNIQLGIWIVSTARQDPSLTFSIVTHCTSILSQINRGKNWYEIIIKKNQKKENQKRLQK